MLHGSTAEEDAALELAKQDGGALGRIPERLRSFRVCRAAVENDGMALEHVPVQNAVIRLAAVRQNGMALQFVRLPDVDVCIEAARQTEDALQFVPVMWRRGIMKILAEDSAKEAAGEDGGPSPSP